MSLLWCRFDCDWQEDPFIAPLPGEERHVVGTIRTIAARQGEPTWRAPEGDEEGPQPEHMRLGLRWLTPEYVAARANVPVPVARKVLELMRAKPEDGSEPRIVVELDLKSALVRNVAEINARALKDVVRRRRGGGSTQVHPQPVSGGSAPVPQRAAEPTRHARVEGRKEGRKEDGEAPPASLALVPSTEMPRVPGPLVPLIPESERVAHRRVGLPIIADAHMRSGIFQDIDFANSPMCAMVSDWFDRGYSWAHIVSAYHEIARVMCRPNHGGIRKPAYAIEHLVVNTSHGAVMDWDNRSAGDGTSPRKKKGSTPADLRAESARLAAEGK